MLVAHAMAQFSHECGAGTEMIENLNYTSAARIAEVWPKRFNSATALAYVRSPQKLADKVYNGRMGNRPDSDDGWNFRGRGGSQVTGREGYEKLGQEGGPPTLKVGNPGSREFRPARLPRVLGRGFHPVQLPAVRQEGRRPGRDAPPQWRLHQSGGPGSNGWRAGRRSWLPSTPTPRSPLPAPRRTALCGDGDRGPPVMAIQPGASTSSAIRSATSTPSSGTTPAAQFCNSRPTTTCCRSRATSTPRPRTALNGSPPHRPIAEERKHATVSDLKAKGSQVISAASAVKTAGSVIVGRPPAAGAATDNTDGRIQRARRGSTTSRRSARRSIP